MNLIRIGRLRVAHEVHPMTCPTLPVVGGIQQGTHKGAFAIPGRVGEESLDILQLRRQTGNGEVYAPHPHPVISRPSWFQLLSFQLPEHKAINRIRRPGRVLYLGRLNLPGRLPDPGQAVAEFLEVGLPGQVRFRLSKNMACQSKEAEKADGSHSIIKVFGRELKVEPFYILAEIHMLIKKFVLP